MNEVNKYCNIIQENILGCLTAHSYFSSFVSSLVHHIHEWYMCVLKLLYDKGNRCFQMFNFMNQSWKQKSRQKRERMSRKTNGTRLVASKEKIPWLMKFFFFSSNQHKYGPSALKNRKGSVVAIHLWLSLINLNRWNDG